LSKGLRLIQARAMRSNSNTSLPTRPTSSAENFFSARGPRSFLRTRRVRGGSRTKGQSRHHVCPAR
jgi:hypothetical protein